MKWYKRKINLIFTGVSALLLLFSVGSANNVSAHRIHHYQHRVCRIVTGKHRYGTLHFRKRRLHSHVRKTSSAKIKSEIYHGTLNDINNDRRQYHLRKLKINHRLSKIGTERSYQLQKYFSHNTPQHLNETYYLLHRYHIKSTYYGENIASSPLYTINEIAVGSYITPTSAVPQTLTYRADNGYQLADNINDASMNHDEGDDNGHRNNILDPKFKRIGIGVSYGYDRQNKVYSYYIAVEFTS